MSSSSGCSIKNELNNDENEGKKNQNYQNVTVEKRTEQYVFFTILIRQQLVTAHASAFYVIRVLITFIDSPRRFSHRIEISKFTPV